MSNQELSVVYFRDRVTSEVDRLQELCKKWQAIIDSKEDGDKVDEHERADDIRCAIGKATILISGRIRQFRSLIDDCERWEKEGESTTEPERPKTKVTDLQGFWEMVSIQIADVDKLFQDLDKPKGEETTEAALKKRSKSMEKPKSENTTPTSNVAKKRSASSALKAHISAKRRELKDGEAATPEDKAKEGLTPSKPIVLSTNVDENGEPKDKIFDGGFFKVQSPACTGSPKVRAPKGGSDLLSPSGFNSRPPKKTPSSATPLAVMRATKASRKSLSPSAMNAKKATLDYDC